MVPANTPHNIFKAYFLLNESILDELAIKFGTDKSKIKEIQYLVFIITRDDYKNHVNDIIVHEDTIFPLVNGERYPINIKYYENPSTLVIGVDIVDYKIAIVMIIRDLLSQEVYKV